MRLVLDTPLLVEAIRSSTGREALEAYYVRTVRFNWMSAVVAEELLAGAAPKGDRTSPESLLLRPFLKRDRVLTPSQWAWKRAGEAVAALHARGRIDRAEITKAFQNDVLLAASCADSKSVLVTRNTKVFRVIAEEIPFRYVTPWP